MGKAGRTSRVQEYQGVQVIERYLVVVSLNLVLTLYLSNKLVI